jgi:hypothetical protein
MSNRPLAHYLKRYPSELDGKQLVQNRLDMVRRDVEWRHRFVDFDKCAKLYENTSGTNIKEGIPRVNLIRRAVEDYISVALSNIPKAQLVHVKNYSQITNPLEKAIIEEVRHDAEETINNFVRTVLLDNEYDDISEHAIRQAAIFGVGYLMAEIDSSLDTRFSFELRELLGKNRNDWTEDDAKKYEVLSKRIAVSHVDSRDVYWQYGRRKIDKDTLRVSIVERADVQVLRDIYDNEDIRPGAYPYYINEDRTNEGDIAAIITTWEIEPVYTEKNITGGAKAYARDWQLVKTVIVGGQLVEKTVTDSSDGPLSLPLIPFYLRESEHHQYGFSIPMMLEVSEEFINLMRVMIYKSAKNAVSPQGVIISGGKLTPKDLQKVNHVIFNGGAAALEGNEDGPLDIRNVVMPLSFNQSSLSSAAVEAMSNEERVFQIQSQTLDETALARAESGMAKRTQILANDRPKTISLGLISRSVEHLFDRIYELIRIYYREEVSITLEIPGEGRQEVPLNRPMQDYIPAMDEEGNMFASYEYVNEDNPMGIAPQEINYKINDTTLSMIAQADGRGSLPVDPYARFNILYTYLQTGAIELETFRELSLDEEIKMRDDKNRELRAQREMEQLQQMQQQMQQQQMGGVDPSAFSDNPYDAENSSMDYSQNVGMPSELHQGPTTQEIAQDMSQTTALNQLGGMF